MSQPTVLSDSQMSKWKTLTALASADGNSCAEEQKFIKDWLEKRDVDKGQRDEILATFNSGVSPGEHFKGITNPRDRGSLFYLARLMFFKDGEFCDYEKMYYDRFKAEHMSGIDMNAVMQEVRSIEDEYKTKEKSQGALGTFKSLMQKYF